MDGTQPTVSFVVPARNEATYLSATLRSIQDLSPSVSYETIVVDGRSDDPTPEIARDHGVRLIDGEARGQGGDRHLGAQAADGEWFAFVDADTRLRPRYLDTMLSFVGDHGLAGATSRCRVTGGWRTVPIEWLFNHVLPRLSPPPFPGFNVFVSRAAYFDVDGFTSGPNEDMTFSRRLGRRHPTGVCPTVSVETSGRRFERDGLLGAVSYYTQLEFERQFRTRCRRP